MRLINGGQTMGLRKALMAAVLMAGLSSFGHRSVHHAADRIIFVRTLSVYHSLSGANSTSGAIMKPNADILLTGNVCFRKSPGEQASRLRYGLYRRRPACPDLQEHII